MTADPVQSAPPVPEQAVRAVMRLTLRRGCPVGRETAEEIVAAVLACALASPDRGASNDGMTTNDSTPFARLGGAEAIEAVTAEFYRRVLADPLLSPHFEGVDMARQAGMLTAFLALATGGPEQYRGRDLRTAHARLDIGDEEFDAVAGHLAAALKDARVSDDLIDDVMTAAGSVREEVLGR